jgi:hypothetical protein
MGLLDEAIREHLELKRRRGADPSAIAREEREALAPVFPDEALDDDGAAAVEQPETPDIAPPTVPVEAPTYEHAELGDLSAVGQETAELDMRAVLDGDLDTDDGSLPAGPVGAEPVSALPAEEIPAEEPLDWEFPDEEAREPEPEQIPGQERLSFE